MMQTGVNQPISGSDLPHFDRPGPWRFRLVHSEGRLTAAILETTAPNPPLNDPALFAVREDWLQLFSLPEDAPRKVALRLVEAAPESVSAMQALWEFASSMAAKHGKDGLDSMPDQDQNAWAVASALYAKAKATIQGMPRIQAQTDPTANLPNG
jgi:hypothetical protein